MIALVWIVATVALYAASRALARRFLSPWLSPLLVVPGVLVVLLLATRTPYPTYLRGGRWLLALLGPTTVAFAVPLHRHRDLIRRYAVELVAGIATGSAVAVVSSAVSMLPRSITTPFAMQVATTLGGSPVLAAVFVIVTALVGVVSGRALVGRLPLRSPIARGALLGMGAHGAGTALALELGAVEGAVSGLVMIGAGLLLLFGAPVLQLALGAA